MYELPGTRQKSDWLNLDYTACTIDDEKSVHTSIEPGFINEVAINSECRPGPHPTSNILLLLNMLLIIAQLIRLCIEYSSTVPLYHSHIRFHLVCCSSCFIFYFSNSSFYISILYFIYFYYYYFFINL